VWMCGCAEVWTQKRDSLPAYEAVVLPVPVRYLVE